MLKFSANLSLLFTERPLPERFAAARTAGFSAVEIQFPYELAIAELQELLEENSLELVLINVPAGDLMQGGDGLACVPDRVDAFRQAVAQAVEYAEALAVPNVNVLAGRQPAGLSRDACLATLADNLRHAVPMLAKVKSGTVLEAINVFDMPRFLIHSVSDMQRLCDGISGLKMQFDCYHMSRMGEDVLSELRQNLALIGHVQFADNPGRHEPGTGKIDYKPVFSLLAGSDYAGYCGAEYKPSHLTEDTLGWLPRS
jgi:hydroxypyruvate isomerase